LNKLNEELNESMTNSEIDINQRRLQISKFLENPLIHFKISNDPFDIGVNVHINFDRVLQLIDESVMIIDSSVLNMEIPLINSSEKGDPIVTLKWNDNIPTEWKNQVIFQVEMKQLPIEFKDLNETEMKKKEESKDEKEEETEKEKENWKKICETKENKMELKRNECQWNQCYAFRIRGFFREKKSFTQYSNLQF